jgi:hypothetical protein
MESEPALMAEVYAFEIDVYSVESEPALTAEVYAFEIDVYSWARYSSGDEWPQDEPVD